MTGEFPTQKASNAENASIGWRHHEIELKSSRNVEKSASRKMILQLSKNYCYYGGAIGKFRIWVYRLNFKEYIKCHNLT